VRRKKTERKKKSGIIESSLPRWTICRSEGTPPPQRHMKVGRQMASDPDIARGPRPARAEIQKGIKFTRLGGKGRRLYATFGLKFKKGQRRKSSSIWDKPLLITW